MPEFELRSIYPILVIKWFINMTSSVKASLSLRVAGMSEGKGITDIKN